eukprot:5445994-Amphidinium_carterae.1
MENVHNSMNELEKIKAYLSVHNANIDDIMDDCTKSVTVIVFGDIQDKYTSDESRILNNRFPVALQKGDDNYDEYMDLAVNIRKMMDDIVNFSQTRNCVLPHAIKPGSEARSITRRVMRQSNGFESWRQLHLHFARGHGAQQFSFLRGNHATKLEQRHSTIHEAVLQLAGRYQ